MVKIATQCSIFFVCINVAKLTISVQLATYGDFHHTVWLNSQKYIAQITKQYGSRQCGNYCHTQYVVYYHTHSKNLGRCGKNPQSARRKPNYHTTCGKNCHKILSVQSSPTLKKLSARKTRLKVRCSSKLDRRGEDLLLHISVIFTPIDLKFLQKNLNMLYIIKKFKKITYPALKR